ncbi:Centromere/kinetochore protein zw10 [Phlyctochytrium planicorne]|nr:Centromere/kinetochore protein zw10 [Phlyctochytrium planicorne]
MDSETVELSFEDQLEATKANPNKHTTPDIFLNSFYITYVGDKVYDCTIDQDLTSLKDNLHRLKKQHNPVMKQTMQLYDSFLEMMVLVIKIHRELQNLEILLQNESLKEAATAISDANAMLEEVVRFDAIKLPMEAYVALRNDFLAKKSSFRHKCQELFRQFFSFTSSGDHVELLISHNVQDTVRIFDLTLSTVRAVFSSFLQELQVVSIRTTISGTFQNAIVPFLVKEVLEKCFLEDTSEKEDVSMLAEKIVELDRGLKAEGVLDEDRQELLTFATQAEASYIKTKRNVILKRVKEIIEDVSTNTVEISSSSGLEAVYSKKANSSNDKGTKGQSTNEVRFPTCHVSVQATTIMDTVHELLQEAEKVDKESGMELFYCARDVFDMYRSLWPEIHAESIRADPVRAMILFNDCDYFCYQMMTLAFRYKKCLHDPFSIIGTNADLIPNFRKLGETYLRHQMRKQRDIIKGLLPKEGEIRGLKEDNDFQAIEYALECTVGHILHLGKLWKPLSQTVIYLESMGLLIDSFLPNIVDEIGSFDQTSKRTLHQFRFAVNLLLRLEGMFEARASDGVKSWVVVPAQRFVKSWPRLVELNQKLL